MGAITLQIPARGLSARFSGWCSHVDSVMDDDRLLGARLDGGLQIRSPNYEKWSRRARRTFGSVLQGTRLLLFIFN
jgi:hypothetical protein